MNAVAGAAPSETPSEPERPRGFSLSDLWLSAAVLLTSLAGHLWWLSAGGPDGNTGYPRDIALDEGTVLYEAFRVSEGDLMYRDFFAFQGPLFSYVNAAAFRLAGFSFPLAQGLQVSVNAISAVLLALVVARIAGRLAGFASALFFVTVLVPMWPYAYPHWYALLFAHGALAVLFLANFSRFSTALAGGLAGLCLWTIQSLGSALFVGLVVALASDALLRKSLREAFRRVSLLCSGLLAASVVCLWPFLWKGAWSEVWWSMFEWPFLHYRGINATPYGAFLTDHLNRNRAQPHLWRLLSQAGVVLIAALPLAAVVSGVAVVYTTWLSKLRKLETPSAQVFVASTTAVMSLLPLVSGTRRDVVHLAFLSSFGLIALAGAGSVLSAWRVRGWARRTVFLLCGLLASNHGWKIYRSETRDDRPHDFRSQWLSRFEWAPSLAEATKPGDLVVIGYEGAGGSSALHTGTKQAISFTYLPFEWRAHSDYLSHRQWEQAAAEIMQRRPKVLAIDGEQWARLTGIEPRLADRYLASGSLRVLSEP